MKKLIAAIVLMTMVLTGCGERTITRTDPGLITDLSGRWNDSDARMVAQALVEKALVAPWLNNYRAENESARPTIMVGNVYNITSEHIDTDVYMDEMESAFINSGMVRVVARPTERGDLRAEQENQQARATDASAAAIGAELGADYVLMGSLKSIVDQYGDERVIYYQASLDLIAVETTEKVWAGNHEIKKILEW